MSDQNRLDEEERQTNGLRHQSVYPEEEIDLLEYWRILVKYRRLIFKSMAGAAVLSAVVALLFMPNVYRAEIMIAPVASEDSKGGLASMLGGAGSLGGLASLAGISLGDGGSTEEYLTVLQSNEFLWKFVQENKLMPILFEKKWWEIIELGDPPGQWDAYRLLTEEGVLRVSTEKSTGIVTIAVEWKDARLAAQWANALVARLNGYLAQHAIERSENNLNYLNEELMRTQVEEMRKTLFDLVANEQKHAMIAKTQKEFAFKVIDAAVVPDKKIKPKRSLIVILAIFIAGILSAFVAFLKEGVLKRRERMASLG